MFLNLEVFSWCVKLPYLFKQLLCVTSDRRSGPGEAFWMCGHRNWKGFHGAETYSVGTYSVRLFQYLGWEVSSVEVCQHPDVATIREIHG